MEKYKVLALVGKSGSGKDTLRKHIIQSDRDRFNPIVRDSSRPRREGEWNGIDYNFVDTIIFALNDYHEEVIYNNWHYGTRKGSLLEDKINIGCFDQDATIQLMEDPEIDLYIIFVDVPDKTRLIRQLNREIHPNIEEIIRRYGTDKVDYSPKIMAYLERNENGISRIVNDKSPDSIARAVIKLLDIYYKI